jgi:hypothetical protein
MTTQIQSDGAPSRCDWVGPKWLRSGRRIYCNLPVKFYALSTDAPQIWSTDIDAPGSLGAYCCLRHANDEPRPSLAAAKRMYGMLLEQLTCGCGHCDLDAARDICKKLIHAYPNPVPASEFR